MATCIGSTPFEDLERGARFVGDEIVLTTHEEPLRRVELFAEADMINDLCDEEEEQ